MKTSIPFLLFALCVLLGCENKSISDVNEVSNMQNFNSQILEIAGEISEIEELVGKLPGGYQSIAMGQASILLSDKLNVLIGRSNLKTTKVNLMVTKANLEASQKLIQSIEQFDRNSTKLSKRMLCLTWIIAILTCFIAVLTFEQITDKWLYRKFSSYKSASINASLEEKVTIEPSKNTKTNSTSQTNFSKKESDTEAHNTNSVRPSG